jgi:hypothetical protein
MDSEVIKQLYYNCRSSVKAVKNISTAALRVAKGDEKGN